MTIPEASRPILQAGSMGKNGEILIPKMGVSAKVAEMTGNLIRFSGKESHSDVKKFHTGLRDEENLYEVLITHGGGIFETRHEKNGPWC